MRSHATIGPVTLAALLVLTTLVTAPHAWAAGRHAKPAPRATGAPIVIEDPDAPVPDSSLVQTDALAAQLKDTKHAKPFLVHVGFKRLYRGGHIPDSPYAGPTSEPEGIAALTKTLTSVPRTQAIVLYCGCCPWEHCPNVRPAYHRARAMGFTRVKVLRIDHDLQRDWAEKGFPVKDGE